MTDRRVLVSGSYPTSMARRIVRTSDGGQTWRPVELGAYLAWLKGEHSVLRSTDGLTWEPVTLP